jgi:flagellar protein FlaF
MSYDLVEREVAAGRGLEARVLLRSAMRLNDAITGTSAEELFTAVSLNNKLWLLFTSEIESGRVALPPEVAQNIVALAAFVLKAAVQAFSRDRATLETLVNINRRIAAGLSVQAGEADAPASAPADSSGAGFVTSA